MSNVHEIRPGVLTSGQDDTQQPPAAEASQAGNAKPVAANDEPKHGGRDGGGSGDSGDGQSGLPRWLLILGMCVTLITLIILSLSQMADNYLRHVERMTDKQNQRRAIENGYKEVPPVAPVATQEKPKVETEKNSFFPPINLWPPSKEKSEPSHKNQQANQTVSSTEGQCSFVDFQHENGKVYETTMLSAGMSCKFTGRKAFDGLYFKDRFNYIQSAWKMQSCDGSEFYSYKGIDVKDTLQAGNHGSVEMLLLSGKCVKISVERGRVHVGYLKQ